MNGGGKSQVTKLSLTLRVTSQHLLATLPRRPTGKPAVHDAVTAKPLTLKYCSRLFVPFAMPPWIGSAILPQLMIPRW